MTTKVITLREAIYMLDSVQEGAIPHIEVNEAEQKVIVSEVWVSSHFEEEEVPSSFSVSEEIFSITQEFFPNYKVEVSVRDINGKEETFTKA